jgi:hypothetical protein
MALAAKPFNVPVAFNKAVTVQDPGLVDAAPMRRQDVVGVYQPIDALLTAMAALSTANNKGVYFTGTDTVSMYDLTSYGRTLAGLADAAALKSNISLSSSDSPTFAGLTVNGQFVHNGDTVTTTSERVLMSSNFDIKNAGYTAQSAQKGGFVVVRQSTATGTTGSGAGVFTPGDNGVSNPSVTVASSSGFAAGDIVQVSSTASNDGLFEVAAVSSGVLELKSSAHGLNARTLDFTSDDLVAETNTSAVVRKVEVVSVRANGANLEIAMGSSTSSFSYSAFFKSDADADALAIDGSATNYTAADATIIGHLSGIDSALGTINTTLSSHTTSIGTLETDVGTLQADLTALDDRVTDLEGTPAGTPYKTTDFNSTSDWTSDSGDYIIEVTAGTHAKGNNPAVQLWEKVGSTTEYRECTANRAQISVDGSDGKVTIRVGSTERFAGYALIG